MSQGKGFAMEIRSCAAEGGVEESEDQRDATNRPREALVQWSIQNRIGRQGRSIQMLSRTPKESRWRPQKCVASTPASGERVAVGQQLVSRRGLHADWECREQMESPGSLCLPPCLITVAWFRMEWLHLPSSLLRLLQLSFT